MAEMTLDARTLVKHMNSLIELDFDAIEAYEAARIARLSEVGDKAELGRFLLDHQRHIADLTPFVQELGGKPATKADFKRILTKGKVVLGGLAGDRFVLEAMKSNEETTTKTYARAAGEPGIPIRMREVLARNLSDEQRHLAWLEQRLTGESRRHDAPGT